MATVREALDRVLTALTQHGSPVVEHLQPGLSRQEIEAHMESFSFQLPAEVYELYQWHNGSGDLYSFDHMFFPSFIFLSLEAALEHYHLSVLAAQVVATESGLDPSLLWRPEWFPISTNGAADYYVVAGADHPHTASPVFLIENEDRRPQQQYASLTTMLLTIAACYETGVYYQVVDPHLGNILEGDLAGVQRLRQTIEPDS